MSSALRKGFEFDVMKKTFRSDGMTVNTMKIPAGCSIGKHVHPYSHLSCLVSGRVILSVMGSPDVELKGLSFIEIEKYKSHVITAIEDSVWMCLHASSVMDEDNLKLVEA